LGTRRGKRKKEITREVRREEASKNMKKEHITILLSTCSNFHCHDNYRGKRDSEHRKENTVPLSGEGKEKM